VLLDLSMPAGGISALWRIRALPAVPKVAMPTVSEEDDDMMQAQDAARRDRAANDLAAARILHEIAAAEDDLAPAAIVGHLDGAAAAADLDDGLQARDPPAAWRLHQGIAGVFHIAAPRRAGYEATTRPRTSRDSKMPPRRRSTSPSA